MKFTSLILLLIVFILSMSKFIILKKFPNQRTKLPRNMKQQKRGTSSYQFALESKKSFNFFIIF